MSDSVRQWKRVCEVLVGKQGSGLLVRDLRIKFEIVKASDATPNTADIKIYNLAPSNEEKVKKEFDEVLVNAGYQGNQLMIFRGNIKHVYRYRDGSDYITQILAADGDTDYRNAIMHETLAAGTTDEQLIKRAVATMPNTTLGYAEVVGKVRRRGKVVSGNTRDVLSKYTRDSDFSWSIQDGQLVIVPTDGVLPDEAVVIRANTGMIGAPEVNDKGVSAKCLLNPTIKVNGRIQLDNNSIKAKVQANVPLDKTKKETEGEPARLDPDGIYKVLKVVHNGDTRANEWYTTIESLALGTPAKKGKVVKK